MARPCGCSGECGCTYVGINGINVTGAGTTRDPGKISLSNPITGAGCDAIMSCVSARLGIALGWNASLGRINVVISSDGGNGLTLGSDGGLYASGSGGGGDGGFATVDGLIARTSKIIGGSYGAGISMAPEGPLETYETALNLRLPIIHVPVRRSAESSLWAVHYYNLGPYNFRFALDYSDTMDMAMGPHMIFTPGGEPTSTADPVQWIYAPKGGYFGYGSEVRHGLLRLSDVFSLVQRRSVLYLEVKDLGASVNDRPDPLATFTVLAEQLVQFGLTQSVIVGCELPNTASAGDLTQLRDGLTLIKNTGTAIATHLNSEAQMDANTPASLVTLGVSWVFINAALADPATSAPIAAKVKAYKDAGLNVMLHSATRQWQYNQLNNTTTFGAGGLKGAIAFDPVYVGGALNNQPHRKNAATWGWGTPDYGRHSPWSNSGYDGQRDKYRGYVENGVGGQINLDADIINPFDTPGALLPSGYHILMGEQCPIPYTSYDIDCTFIWETRPTDTGRWMDIWCCSPEDRNIYEWTKANQFTKGYQFQLTVSGLFVMARYDGIPSNGSESPPPYQYSLAWDSPWSGGGISGGTEYRVKVRVRPDRIVMGPSGQSEGGANTRTFNAGTGGGTTWRGAYAYVGRHFFFQSNAVRVRWKDFVITPV